MSATAANLMERVLPQTGLRQWVLTFPFPWRRRLAQDGALFGKLTRIFVGTVQTFYAERAAREGAVGAKTGAVTGVQRTSSDLRLNPHLHMVALDGAWHEQGGELCWQGLGQLKTSEVGAVLESTLRRIERHLRRAGLLGIDQDGADPDVADDPESNLAASAVSGQTPPAGGTVRSTVPTGPLCGQVYGDLDLSLLRRTLCRRLAGNEGFAVLGDAVDGRQ